MKYLVLVLTFLISPVSAQTALQPLIDAALPESTVTLPDGVYDDVATVYIRKSLSLVGSRNATVHSEFQITDGANARFSGFTLEMNKIGAPEHNGVGAVYPQNGMVVVLGANLWADDLDVRLVSGLTGAALRKNAFHVVNGLLHLRAVTEFSRIDWRNSPWQVVELLYNSYANIFSLTGDIANAPFNINSGTTSVGCSVGAGCAAIEVAGSKVTLSGANVTNFGSALIGVYGLRDAYVQIGAGAYTSVQGYGSGAVTLDVTSRKIIAPGTSVN